MEKYETLCSRYPIYSFQKDLSDCFDVFDFAETLEIKTSYDLLSLTDCFDVMNLITDLCFDVQEYYEDRNNEVLIIRSNIIDASDVNEVLGRHRQNSFLKSIVVRALQMFYFDQDITSYGTNLEITSRSWVMNNSRNIDLSGKNGEALIQCDSFSGKPGRPGYPGGSFCCYSNQVFGNGGLTINVSGGNGGNGTYGQNGCDGSRGQDANSNVTQNSKTLKVDVIYDDYADYCTYTVYVNYGSCGEKGGNAGAGGCGGAGAKCGSVKTLSSINHKVINNDGRKGMDGKSGYPGKGGQYGSNYQKDYVLLKPNNWGWLNPIKWVTGPLSTGWKGGSYLVESNQFADDGYWPSHPNTAGIKNPAQPSWGDLEWYSLDGCLNNLSFKKFPSDITSNVM